MQEHLGMPRWQKQSQEPGQEDIQWQTAKQQASCAMLREGKGREEVSYDY